MRIDIHDVSQANTLHTDVLSTVLLLFLMLTLASIIERCVNYITRKLEMFRLANHSIFFYSSYFTPKTNLKICQSGDNPTPLYILL